MTRLRDWLDGLAVLAVYATAVPLNEAALAELDKEHGDGK